MRQNQAQNQKRSRGRGRRNGNYGQTHFNRNTTFESNGPEGRLRGNAQQLYEKYTALANDANSAGERISAEACSQFADHYYRINQTIALAAEQQRRTQEEQRASRRAAHAHGERASESPASADDSQSETAQADAPTASDDNQKGREDESPVKDEDTSEAVA